MSTKKATKRALLTSILAICLCLVMLIGSTFAWFTDTASTNVNQIVSGTLDVDIVTPDDNHTSLTGANAEKLKFVKNADAPTTEAVLWEPGCTYVTEGFQIANKGNLALKWKAEVNKGTTEANAKNADLLQVIEFSVVTEKSKTATPINEFVGKLAAGTNSVPTYSNDTYYIMGHMKEEAGNDYQGLTLDGISITVYATQDTVENDSFGPNYDESAGYPVANAGELKTALAAGGVISVKNEIKTDNIDDTEGNRVIISQPTTLNLDAKIVSPDNMGNNNTNFCALIVDADTTINASANGGIDTGTNGGYGINVRNGATLTINGGNYYGGGTTVQVQKGTLIINDGFFACEPYSDPTYGSEYLINCIDSAYKDGTAKITVKGGTFVNFNPANCKAEGAGTNFVADGYKVVSETQSNGDIWYTVVPE